MVLGAAQLDALGARGPYLVAVARQAVLHCLCAHCIHMEGLALFLLCEIDANAPQVV